MNYRHIFHAGNICDVVKHATLTLVLEHLRAKEKPFFVLDTHAGVGFYDLQDPRAQKTGEAQDGILRLLKAPPLALLAPYHAALQTFNAGSFRFYPGSPLLTQTFLRAHDRLIACELHGEDIEELRRHSRACPNIHVHHRDGYESLRAFLPPTEKRGLVLIDPPYEQPDEFERLAEHLIAATQRWPQGIFMVWYPIKERPAIWRFHEQLLAGGIPPALCAEFIYQEETRADRLNGSGLIIFNPPFLLDAKIRELFPALHQTLQTEYRGTVVKWLNPETPAR